MNSYTASVLAGLAAFVAVAVYGAIRSAAATRPAGPRPPRPVLLGQAHLDCLTCQRVTLHRLYRAAPPTCLTCMTTPGSPQ